MVNVISMPRTPPSTRAPTTSSAAARLPAHHGEQTQLPVLSRVRSGSIVSSPFLALDARTAAPQRERLLGRWKSLQVPWNGHRARAAGVGHVQALLGAPSPQPSGQEARDERVTRPTVSTTSTGYAAFSETPRSSTAKAFSRGGRPRFRPVCPAGPL